MAIITSTSFKGTTTEALAATAAQINANTKVTITDNTYTAANLLTILGKTSNLPVILEKTAAGIPLSADPAVLVTIIEGVNKYTGDLTAITTDPTAEQLNIIAKGTTGKVTATLDSTTLINAATVAALKDVSSSDNITFVTAETKIVGKSDLEAFVALNKKLSDPSWATIVKFEGTASELSAIKSALGIKKTADVEITSGQISAADANALSKAGGALTASLKPGTVKATLSALKDIKATDVLDFTTTETTVNASDLVALETKLVAGTQDYTSITTITETAAAVAKDVTTVTTALGYTLATTVDVKISGNISATNAATIAGLTTGTLTATIFPGTAQNLEAALNGVNGALTLILTDETVVAGDLDALTAVTTVAINANSVKTITAAAADVAKVSDVYDAAALKQISGLGNEIISITGGAISAADTNTLAGLTSGKVVAAVTAGSAATLLAALDKADAKDELTLEVTGVSTAKDLLALDAKTAIIVDASAVTDITGTAAEIKKVFAAKGIEVGINVDIDVTDTAASAADVNAIAKATDGDVTATVATGTAAALNKALADAKGTDALTLKISKGTAAAKDLTDLDAKTSENVKAEDVTLITGTFAEVNAALSAGGIDTATNVAATLSGTVAAGDATTVANLTTGVVTATIAAGTAAALNGALTDTIFPTGGNAYTLSVNNAAGTAAAATVLNALDGKTSVKVKVDAVEVNGDYADLEKVYVTNKAGFANLGDEKVEITDAGGVTADKVNVIAKATKGEVKATVAANTADVLVANLKDASATDALDLTVNGASAKAADLNTLVGKTNVAINVGAVAINGNIADVTKVFITNAGNFTSEEDNNVTISGTVTAAQADAIADATSGVVTANIAADTVANLNTALTDVTTNAYTLTVNGATASAATLELLNAKTSVDIKVDAKEVTGIFTELNEVYVTKASDYENLGNENIKITGLTVAAADANTIANKTSGVVTATITQAEAATLNAALDDKTVGQKTVNAYSLTVNNTVGGAAAAHLKALDDKTSVVVDASAVTAINGSAADIKTVLAAKTITTAANVAANVDGVISAADANTISKATTGVVTATVDAGTAAALKSALAGVANDALTLTVSGTSATAADLNALDAKTSVDVNATAVSKITGNAADVKTAVAGNIDLDAAVAIDVSGTVSVADANTIAITTTGKVTATIAAGTAADLVSLSDGTDVNAYKLTVSGDDADAADLLTLDALTSVTVNAAAIKNIIADNTNGAAEVKAVYDANANKTISGLGNETVDLSSATDASVGLVKAINDFTTGVITLDTVNVSAGNFSLSQLGDLKGITGLNTLDVSAGNTNITLSLKDLLASNDSTNSFAFDIDNGAVGDTVKFADTTGWTADTTNSATGVTLYTNDVTSQVITINHTDVVVVA